MSDPFDRQELLTRMYQEGYKDGRKSARKGESMSDLVSRELVIDAIERNAYRHTYIDQIVGIIKELPSAEPVRKGKWIAKVLYPGSDAKFFACNVCDKPVWWVSDFCPNCGADMRGEEDEDD